MKVMFMKSLKPLTLLLALTLISFIGFTACNSGGTKTGQMSVSMTDAPADYEEVNINIESVLVKRDDEDDDDSDNEGDDSDGNDDEDEFITILDDPITVNLLNLRNGNTVSLGSTELETGEYSQIRFILGDNNTIVVDGQTYDLQTPSGQQSGLKIQIDAEIEEDENFELLIDFDAGQSVVETGNGSYILKPVIRAVNVDLAGSISGTVEPNTFQTYAFAAADGDTLSTYNEDGGEFEISALAPGSYNVTLQPDSDQYRDTTITDVQVIEGEETELGTISLPEASTL